MTAPGSLRITSPEPRIPEELRRILNSSEAEGPSAQDLERLAARMAPLVGLGVDTLHAPALPRGSAPANVAPTPALTGSLAKSGLGKLASSAAVKVVAAVLVAGTGVWWAARTLPPEPKQQPALSVAVKAPATAPAVITAPAAQSPEVRPEPVSEPALAVRTPKKAVVAADAPDELSLIQQAQALRGQGDAMLTVLTRHARLYPNGMLSQEREVLAIEALVSAGRLPQARTRAARLAAKYPNSAHLPRVHALLEKGAGQ